MSEGIASTMNSHFHPANPPTPSSPSSAAETGEPSAEDSGIDAMK